jgi:uncharacterized protein YbjT (DUF2867 family)
MKVAITGGTGFVGRHLAKRLLDEGHEVLLLARHAPANADMGDEDEELETGAKNG